MKKPSKDRLADGFVLAAMRRTLTIETNALEALSDSLGSPAVEAVRTIASIEGRVVCTGVGKSGHVARKIAATLASTGTPAIYVHPAEASHGDLGMITDADCVLALSRSGETAELGDIVDYCDDVGIPLIAMTAGEDSTLAKRAKILLLQPNTPEACTETKAPTSSTTVAMAYGDALAVALIDARGFTKEDFKVFHPGGSLGNSLAPVSELMHPGSAMPLVKSGSNMGDALIELSEKGFGCVGVLDTDGTLAGIVTDGDLRRKMSGDLINTAVEHVMTAFPITVAPETLASEARRIMSAGDRKITQLFVCDENNAPVGLLHIHDLVRAGVS